MPPTTYGTITYNQAGMGITCGNGDSFVITSDGLWQSCGICRAIANLTIVITTPTTHANLREERTTEISPCGYRKPII
jgi:hypothetical protein